MERMSAGMANAVSRDTAKSDEGVRRDRQLRGLLGGDATAISRQDRQFRGKTNSRCDGTKFGACPQRKC